MKKYWTLLISLALIISGCATNKTTSSSSSEPVTPPGLPEDEYSKLPDTISDYKGITAIDCRISRTGGYTYTTKDFHIDLDYTKFVSQDLSVFNKNWAALASAMSVDIYFKDSVIEVKNPVTGKYETDHTPNSFAKFIGGQDPRFFDLQVCDKYETDPYDFLGLGFTHVDFTYNNRKQQVFFLNLRGTREAEEWFSNLDMGYADSQLYTKDREKEHPDWTDTTNFKGFDVTKNRVMKYVNRYINAYKDSSAEQTYALFSHSRGSAVANLVAKELIDTNLRTVCYALASPHCTEVLKEGNYNTIFNCAADDDFIANFPPDKFGFYNYGQRVEYSLKNDEAAETYKEYFGMDLETMEVEPFVDAFCDLLESRQQVYSFYEEIDETHERFAFPTEREALEKYASLASTFSKDDMSSRYSKVNRPVKENDEWVVTINIAPAIILTIVADIMARVKASPILVVPFALSAVKFLGRYLPYIIRHIDIILDLNVEAFRIAHEADTYLFYYAVLA